ncbi:MAG: hypothetical protein KAT71_05835 [Gammaproteobacteria bacterium]|nr:hypothetical protein [Gammaproteobacteria bacterium]
MAKYYGLLQGQLSIVEIRPFIEQIDNVDFVYRVASLLFSFLNIVLDLYEKNIDLGANVIIYICCISVPIKEIIAKLSPSEELFYVLAGFAATIAGVTPAPRSAEEMRVLFINTRRRLEGWLELFNDAPAPAASKIILVSAESRCQCLEY